MTYSKFLCAGCGKSSDVIGSKVVFILGRKSRVCEKCKLIRERAQQREAQHGSNG